jgi:hypothetical protein
MFRQTLATMTIMAAAHPAAAGPATFLFAGQSNMVGISGDHECAVESLDIPYLWYIESWPEHWYSAPTDTLRSLNAIDDGYSGHGPELSFMCWISDRYAGEIRAVKAASNGTGIEVWQFGHPRLLHQQLTIRALQSGGDPAALVWVQGANDAHSSTTAPVYDTLLAAAVAQWRSTLGGFMVVQSQQHPDTGVGRADYPDAWHTQLVRDAKQRYTDADPNAVLVETAGLELRDCPPAGEGCIHYTRESLDDLGEMLASAFWRKRFPLDINQDGAVDTADLGLLISAFGAGPGDADLNNDDAVDTADLGILISGFGQTLEL